MQTKPLSWDQIRANAAAFVHEWAGESYPTSRGTPRRESSGTTSTGVCVSSQCAADE